MMNKEEIRKQFEEWVKTNPNGNTLILDVFPRGVYCDDITYGAWLGYQAALASKQEEIPDSQKHCGYFYGQGRGLCDKCNSGNHSKCRFVAQSPASKQESNLQRRIDRLVKRLEDYKLKYEGREQELTFHAGYDMGYVEGQLSILEDFPLPIPLASNHENAYMNHDTVKHHENLKKIERDNDGKVNELIEEQEHIEPAQVSQIAELTKINDDQDLLIESLMRTSGLLGSAAQAKRIDELEESNINKHYMSRIEALNFANSQLQGECDNLKKKYEAVRFIALEFCKEMTKADPVKANKLMDKLEKLQ
jgi:hypothetical protein